MGAEGWTDGRFLDDFIDDGLEVDEAWSPEVERVRQVARLRRAVATMVVARGTPRRLGGSASDAELRTDRLTINRVGGRLSNSLIAWAGGGVDVTDERDDPDVRCEGAQIIWERWWHEHRRRVEVEAYRIGTTTKCLGFRKDGNVMVMRLVNEMRSLDEVLGS